MRKMLLWIAGLGLVAASWLIVPALASGLSTSSQTLGAGTSAIPRCDPDGVSTLFELSSTNVSGVTVSGIASSCGGKTLELMLTNGTTTGNGSATIPAGGGSLTVTVSPAVPVTLPNVLQTEISVS